MLKPSDVVNVTLNEFLESSKKEYHDRGTIYMVDVIDKLISLNLNNLTEVVKETRIKRDSFEKYSVDFQYYWSVLTYVEDLDRRFREIESKPAN